MVNIPSSRVQHPDTVNLVLYHQRSNTIMNSSSLSNPYFYFNIPPYEAKDIFSSKLKLASSSPHMAPFRDSSFDDDVCLADVRIRQCGNAVRSQHVNDSSKCHIPVSGQ